MFKAASRRQRFVIISWFIVLSLSLQSANPVFAQTPQLENAQSDTPANTTSSSDTLNASQAIESAATFAPSNILTPPASFAPMPSGSFPEPLPTTNTIPQIVTTTNPEIRQDNVVAKLEPPKGQDKQEAVNVPQIAGDVVHPPKRTHKVQASTAPLYVFLDWGKLKQGQSEQVKLDLQVITPTSSPIDIVVTLPAGLTFDSKSTQRAVYDDTAHTLSIAKLTLVTKSY